MVKRQADLDSFTLVDEPGGRGGLFTAAIVAAAVGAGVALLLAPDKGTKTRKRLAKRFRRLELGKQFEDMELGKRAGSMSEDAADHWKRFRKQAARKIDSERDSGGGGLALALFGTLAGAAAAVLLAPDSGSETRQRLTRKFQDLKTDASSRWQEHRRGSRSESNGSSSHRTEDNVRSVQELGREGEQVF